MDARAAALLGAIGLCASVPARLLLGARESETRAAAAGATGGVRGLAFGKVRLPDVAAFLRRVAPVQEMQRAASASRRKNECLAELPVMLDVVTLGLSAGLSFDSSLALYCGRYDNELSRALAGAMLSWQIGASTREAALKGLEGDLEVAALGRFASCVNESLAFGTPLSASLERQAQVIRDEQRAQIEEEIEKVPVKMLIPLGTLIVPAMLLAILGPLLGSALVVG